MFLYIILIFFYSKLKSLGPDNFINNVSFCLDQSRGEREEGRVIHRSLSFSNESQSIEMNFTHPSEVFRFFEKQQVEHQEHLDYLDQEWEDQVGHLSYLEFKERYSFLSNGSFSKVFVVPQGKRNYVAKVDIDEGQVSKEKLSPQLKEQIKGELNTVVEDFKAHIFFSYLIDLWQGRIESEGEKYFKEKFSDEMNDYLNSNNLEFHLFVFCELLSLLENHDQAWFFFDQKVKLRVMVFYMAMMNALGLNDRLLKEEEELKKIIQSEDFLSQELKDLYISIVSGELFVHTFLREGFELYAWKKLTIKQDQMLIEGEVKKPFMTKYQGSVLLKKGDDSGHYVRVVFSDQYDMSLEACSKGVYQKIRKEGSEWTNEVHFEILEIFQNAITCLSGMQKAQVVNLDALISNYGMRNKSILMDDFDKILTQAQSRKQSFNLVGVASFLLSLLGKEEMKNWDCFKGKGQKLKRYADSSLNRSILIKEWKKRGNQLRLDPFIEASEFIYYYMPLMVDRWLTDIREEKKEKLEMNLDHFDDPVKKIWMILIVQVMRSMVEGDCDYQKLMLWSDFVWKVIENPSLYKKVEAMEEELLCIVKKEKNMEGEETFVFLESVAPPLDSGQQGLKDNFKNLTKEEYQQIVEENMNMSQVPFSLFCKEGNEEWNLPLVQDVFDLYEKRKIIHKERLREKNQYWEDQYKGQTYLDLSQEFVSKKEGSVSQVNFSKNGYVMKVNLKGGEYVKKVDESLKDKIRKEVKYLFHNKSDKEKGDYLDCIISMSSKEELDKEKSSLKSQFSLEVRELLESHNLDVHLFVFFEMLSLTNLKKEGNSYVSERVRLRVLTHYIMILEHMGGGERVWREGEKLKEAIRRSQELSDAKKLEWINILSGKGCSETKLTNGFQEYVWKEVTLKQEEQIQEGKVEEEFIMKYQGAVDVPKNDEENAWVHLVFSDQYDKNMLVMIKKFYFEKGSDVRNWTEGDYKEVMKTMRMQIECLSQMKKAQFVNLDAHLSNYGKKGDKIMMDDFDNFLFNAPDHLQGIHLVGLAYYILSIIVCQKASNIEEILEWGMKRYIRDVSEKIIKPIEDKMKENGLSRSETFKRELQVMRYDTPKSKGVEMSYHNLPLLIDKWAKDIRDDNFSHSFIDLSNALKLSTPVRKVWSMFLVQVARAMVEGDYNVEQLKDWLNLVEKIMEDPSRYKEIEKQEKELLCLVSEKEGHYFLEKQVAPPDIPVRLSTLTREKKLMSLRKIKQKYRLKYLKISA